MKIKSLVSKKHLSSFSLLIGGIVSTVFLFMVCLSLNAEDAENSGSVKRAQKDYAPYPQPGSGYVTDLANLLTVGEEEQIERWLWQVESKTGVEVVVVTIDSIKDYPGTDNDSIESFATGLFNAYGIGNMPANNGILLLVAKKDRKARIELGKGYGRSMDAASEKIMQGTIIPYFKKDQYAKGITEGVREIVLVFAKIRFGVPWTLIICIAAVPILGLIAFSLFKNGKRGWGWAVVGILFILVLVIIRIIFTIMKHLPTSDSSSWSSGGFGGGFGGGSSGGGGATGSW